MMHKNYFIVNIQKKMQLLLFGIILIVLIISILFVTVYGIGEYNCNETFKSIPLRDETSFYSHDKLSKAQKKDSLYSPFVIRPREINALEYSGQCTNELFPHQTSPSGKGEMGSPNAYVEARYYAQRPLLNPDQYYKLIENMLQYIRNSYSNVPNSINKELFIHQDEFSEGNTYSNVMKFIMNIINQAKKKTKSMVEYAKVDTWGGENFAFIDQKVFSFSRYSNDTLSDTAGRGDFAEIEQERAKFARTSKEPKKLIVNFNLYNTLRNISTDVLAEVFYLHGKYYFSDIQITSKKETNHIKPVSISMNKTGNINLNNNDLPGNRGPTPQWIYANTMENQTFNSKGFHDPNGENIFIQGGIPEEFKEIVKADPNAYMTKTYNAQDLPGGPLFAQTNIDNTNSRITPKFPQSAQPQWTVAV